MEGKETAPDSSLYDLELVKRWERGDQDAATELFNRYVNELTKIVGRQISERLKRRVEAEDIVYSSFRSFYRLIADGQVTLSKGSIAGLLSAIARNKLLRQVERNKAKKRSIDREEAAPYELNDHPQEGQESPAGHVFFINELENLLAGLKPKECEIVLLRIQGFSKRDIADHCNLTVGSINHQLRRVRRTLEERVRESVEGS